MFVDRARLLRGVALVIGVVAILVALAAAMPLVWEHWKRTTQAAPSAGESAAAGRLVPDCPDTVELPPEVADTLDIRTEEVRPATDPRKLVFAGKLALDTNHLARIHSRFGGEVVEIPPVPDGLRPGTGSGLRPLRQGDRVTAGQLLAVIWSKELGEKKSELVDALSQLYVDQQILNGMKQFSSSVPMRSIQEQEAKVALDRNAVRRVEGTLRVWRVKQQEIDEVKKDAERIVTSGLPLKEKEWARVEVKAPFAGTIVEKNLALGDIVDTTTNLFLVADLSTLAVWADAYEEDLRALLALPPERRNWTIRLKADPAAEPLEALIDHVGDIIDPNQHTALVMGSVDNRRGRLRANQFITATVALSPDPGEVVIPASALVEDGRASVVFVQDAGGPSRYSLRHVAVSRRLPGTVIVRHAPVEKQQGWQPLRPGERVVRAGAVELKKVLQELQASRAAGE